MTPAIILSTKYKHSEKYFVFGKDVLSKEMKIETVLK